MARFYSNENIAAQLVAEHRRLGHDVLTTLEAGNAKAAVPDAEVLAYDVAQGRILLTNNRRQFLRLHQNRTGHHAGIVLCTFDLDFAAQAGRIHNAIVSAQEMKNQLIRVNRPA